MKRIEIVLTEQNIKIPGRSCMYLIIFVAVIRNKLLIERPYLAVAMATNTKPNSQISIYIIPDR